MGAAIGDVLMLVTTMVLCLAAGERAAGSLNARKAWAGAHNAAIMALLFLVFGFKLVGDGIAVLS
jgi:hypothetical protein